MWDLNQRFTVVEYLDVQSCPSDYQMVLIFTAKVVIVHVFVVKFSGDHEWYLDYKACQQ